MKQFSNPRDPLRQKTSSLEVWFRSTRGKFFKAKVVYLVELSLTHIHLVRVELDTVTPQPVIVPSLRVKIESRKTIERILLSTIIFI